MEAKHCDATPRLELSSQPPAPPLFTVVRKISGLGCRHRKLHHPLDLSLPRCHRVDGFRRDRAKHKEQECHGRFAPSIVLVNRATIASGWHLPPLNLGSGRRRRRLKKTRTATSSWLLFCGCAPTLRSIGPVLTKVALRSRLLDKNR